MLYLKKLVTSRKYTNLETTKKTAFHETLTLPSLAHSQIGATVLHNNITR